MESLSRPFHRKKLSNASSFSAKNAYDGVFSGHRPNFDAVPPVNVEEYREIFSTGQAASSIPVLDLSTLQDSSDGFNLEVGSSKPDYGKIFGGFRDHDIALSYEELVSRDKARAPSSTCLKLQDLGNLSHQPLDDLKQFNMSYNKISKTSKDGLDGTTHVTQLHAEPGFTCFIDESASQPKKENENQKSSIRHNIHPNVNSSKRDFPQKQASQSDEESKSKDCQNERLSDARDLKAFQSGLKSHPYKVSSSLAASQPKKKSENQKSSVTNNVHHDAKVDIPEEKTSQNAVESRSRYNHDESLFDDRNFKTFQADHISHPSKESSSSPAAPANRKYCQNEYLLSDDRDLNAFQADLRRHPSKVLSSPAASQPQKETENQKSSVTNNVHGVKADIPEKVTSQNTVESRSRDNHDESLSNDRNFKTFQANHISRPSKVSSSSSAASANQKTSTATGEEFPPATWFDENLDVNSAAAVSAANLRKALEKAQESIRIAKESVGRKKEGLKGFSSKSFKDSLKVKKARVVNASAVEEQKIKEDTMKESDHELGGTVIFSDFAPSEKLFGANKVIKEIHGKISESTNNSEIPVRSPFELRDNTKLLADKTESESIKINKNEETAQKDNERPNGCLVLESCEKKLLDMQSKENKDTQKLAKSNNLTVYQKVEIEKKLSLDSYQNGDEKRYGEATLGLLETMKQEVPKQEHDEKVANAERQVEDEREDTENHKEEKFNETEMFKNAQTDSISTNEVSPNDYYETKEKEKEKENDKAEEGETWENLDDKFQEAETYENSSSEYDDAEGSESVHGASHIVDDDTEEVRNVNNPKSSQEFDDVSSSSSTSQEFQIVDDTEKDILEDIPADQTPTEANNDEHEVKSDDLTIHGLTDIDFAQNDVRSDSSSDTIHGMEIEVKEYNERKETVEEETDVSGEKKEENNVQQFHEERPKTRIEMEIGTCYQEAKDASREFGPDKVVEKENNKRIEEVSSEERERERIKLAVERAIREARERAFAEARERAALDRATSQGRQRVMADFQEKATKASDKTSALSKLRAERAAVERATAEARQRALEKAISQKKMSEPKIQVNEIKQTSSCSASVSHASALRSKAKLEKHNRIMERAAKALAEKEKRDLLVLREQAERSRLAESLDADIKRWSTGKEGNLRALLSTLQYILGADSGWQPVSLTEIITTNAVKKAYRKATLCVHPDKLQQRGASIQQKYICEKVFDLLKAAWNKFNSEER